MNRCLLLLLLALALPAAVLAADVDESQDALVSLRGLRVIGVELAGDPISPSAKEKFQALEGRELSPSAVRTALLWYHENGGDSLLEIRAVRSRGGVVLRVHSRQRQKIKEIVFDGSHTTATTLLLQQLEMKEGQEYDPEAAKAGAQRLSLFYSKQGYLASDIRYEFDSRRHSLKFTVVEGEPTLLSAVGISPLTTVERKDIRERYEKELMEAFGMKAGDRIQRDKVLEGIQAVKDWLRDHDFLLAKDPVLDYKVSEDGRVNLSLEIAYGTRIRYGFRGNTQFSYRELTSLVSDVKEISSGSDYLSAVRRRVLEAYKEIGFANAKITTLVREDPARGIRYVSLIVNEGSKIPIERVDIEGVFSMDKETARKKFESFGTRLVQRGYFDEAGINRAADLFAEDLRAQGYLSAKLEYVKVDFNPEHTKARASVLISEGVQTRVQTVEIVGVSSFTEEEVRAIFGLRVGEPFNIFQFENGLQKLKDKYQEVGKLSAQIVNEASESIVRYNKDNSEVYIRVELDEGPTFRVGEIIVRGNQQTHARVILRELPFIQGDVLTSTFVNEAEENVRKLNLFSSVILRPIDHPAAEDVKDILIFVEETEPGSFDIVPGLRNDLGARLGLELGYNNLGGWNRNVNVSAVFNRRLQDYYGRDAAIDSDQLMDPTQTPLEKGKWRRPEYRLSLGFREPYLANWPVEFTSNISFLQRQYSKFDANVRRFTMGIKRDLIRYLSGFVEYGYEQIRISDARLPWKRTEEREDYIGSVTPGFVVDSRSDNLGNPAPFNPTRGFYSVNRFELASKIFGSRDNVGYSRSTTHNSAYFQVFDSIVLAFAMNAGWERSNLVGQAIPPLKLFRLGGLGSVRGYSEDGIEMDTRKDIKGALGMVNYRAEARIPLQGSLGTALFIDAGNLMIDRWTFAPEKLRSSIGTGLRYNTPVGPVVLDFAWRLQSDPEVGDTCVTTQSLNTRECEDKPTDRYKIHFAIGVF